MAKYHIQHTQEIAGENKIIFYQGDRRWTTEHEHRKVYDRKADATAELYDFGGQLIKDTDYTP